MWAEWKAELSSQTLPLLLLTKEVEHTPCALSTWGRAGEPGRWGRDSWCQAEACRVGRSNWPCPSPGTSESRAELSQAQLFVKKHTFFPATSPRRRTPCHVLSPGAKQHSTPGGRAGAQVNPHCSSCSTRRLSSLPVRTLSSAASPVVSHASEIMYALSSWRLLRFLFAL